MTLLRKVTLNKFVICVSNAHTFRRCAYCQQQLNTSTNRNVDLKTENKARILYITIKASWPPTLLSIVVVVNIFVVEQPKGPATAAPAAVVGKLVAVMDTLVAAVVDTLGVVVVDMLGVVVAGMPVGVPKVAAAPPNTLVKRLWSGPWQSSKTAAAAAVEPCMDYSPGRKDVATLAARIQTEFGRIESAVVTHHRAALDLVKLVRFEHPRAHRPNYSRPTNPLLQKQIQLLWAVQGQSFYPLEVHRNLNASLPAMDRSR